MLNLPPSEGDNTCLTSVKRKPYILYVKENHVDYLKKKKQAYANTRTQTHNGSSMELI